MDAKALKEENELIRKLGNRDGFFQVYFKELGRQKNGQPVHRTNEDAFNYVNDLHYQYFKEYRYSSYNSFRNVLAQADKSRRK